MHEGFYLHIANWHPKKSSLKRKMS